MGMKHTVQQLKLQDHMKFTAHNLSLAERHILLAYRLVNKMWRSDIYIHIYVHNGESFIPIH